MSTHFTNAKLSPSPSIVIRSIEVREFAWLRPDTPLTPVYHYRTVYGEGGAVRRDVLSAESLLHQIIRTFDGQVEQIGEKIYAYFNRSGAGPVMRSGYRASSISGRGHR